MRSRVSCTVLAIGAALLGSAVPAGAAPALASATAAASVSAYSWNNVRIGAGGFVDGLVFSDAQRGLAYARTDVGGAYRWDAAAKNWVPLLDFTGFNDWNELGVRVHRRRPRERRQGLAGDRASTPSPGRPRRTVRCSAPPTRAARGR